MVSVKSSNFPLAVFTPAAAPPGTCVPSPTWLTNPHRFPWGPPEPDRLHPGLSGRGFHPRFCRFTAEPDSSSSGTHLGCQVPTEGKDGGNTHGFTFLLTYLLTYLLPPPYLRGISKRLVLPCSKYVLTTSETTDFWVPSPF